jgi:hypothetical protein
VRVLLAVAFVIVTAVAAFTYRDLLLRSVPRGVGSGPAVRAVPRRPALSAPAARVPVSPGPPVHDAVTLAVVDSLVGSYMMAIQDFAYDVRAMTDLAFLYMRHGWFDRAIAPLARAREIDPSSEPLRRYLELALARAGGTPVDLERVAREFAELAAEWGMGC